MDRWNGRVALVTGASAGIGSAVAYSLAEKGMKVVACARRLERLEEMAQKNSNIFPIRCDMRKEEDILSMFKEVKQQFGALHVLVNNGGLSQFSTLISGNTSDWREMLDVNVLAVCICTREAISLMESAGVSDGHIVNISSMAAHRLPTGMAGSNFYAATKHTLKAITEGLRRELREKKSLIRVATISPGMVNTEFFEHFLKNDPLKRTSVDFMKAVNDEALTSEDIANTVLHVISAPPHVDINDVMVRPTRQAF